MRSLSPLARLSLIAACSFCLEAYAQLPKLGDREPPAMIGVLAGPKAMFPKDPELVPPKIEVQLSFGPHPPFSAWVHRVAHSSSKICSYPKFRLTEDARSLFVVPQCSPGSKDRARVYTEQLAYSLYQLFSGWSLRSRRARLMLIEPQRPKQIKLSLATLLVEDARDLAQRKGGVMVKAADAAKVDPLFWARMHLFQILLDNGDWQALHINALERKSINIDHPKKLHNILLIEAEAQLIPVPFDFDLSGFVGRPALFEAQAQDDHARYLKRWERPKDVRPRDPLWEVALIQDFQRQHENADQVRKEFLAKRPQVERSLRAAPLPWAVKQRLGRHLRRFYLALSDRLYTAAQR